jgi:hypothetical protein
MDGVFGSDRIYNIVDDEPAPPAEPILFAAQLLGIEPPPEITFAEAQTSMTSTSLSFYADTKRVSNRKLKTVLGVVLEFPTYREGLSELFRCF